MLNKILKAIQLLNLKHYKSVIEVIKMSEKKKLKMQKWRAENSELNRETNRKNVAKYRETHKDDPLHKLRTKLNNQRYHEKKKKEKEKNIQKSQDPFKTKSAKLKAVS